MTREDIEQWTREAGGFDATPEFLKRFAELVARAEREECALMCEEFELLHVAEAIRYRGKA
jgi:hypothetical protein